MFKKLVSNLPFNPGLIEQIGFYSDRLKQESSVRRLSYIFIVMTMLLQIYVVASPPERSLAASSNHVINGVRTKSDLLNAWDRAGSDVPEIYGVFGVTRADIEALPNNPNATVNSKAADYWSIGRNSLRAYSNVADEYINSQVSLMYSGYGTADTSDDKYIYHRALRAWDVRNPSNNYTAFRGTISRTGKTFWILIDCGNLTIVGRQTTPVIPEFPTPPTPTPTPEPEPPKPALDIKKSIVNRPSHLKPNDEFTYRIEYMNKGRNSLAENVFIEDKFDLSKYSIISPKNLDINNGFLRYKVGGLIEDGSGFKVLDIKLRLKDQITSGVTMCNTVTIKASNAKSDSDIVCIGVITPCPFDSNIRDVNNPNCVEPKLVCSLVDADVNLTTRTVKFKTTVTSTNSSNTMVKRYAYDFGDGNKQSFDSNSLSHETSHTYEAGEYEANVTVFYRYTGQEDNEDKSIDCKSPIKFEEDGPLGQTKEVKNITQDKDGDAAIETVVKANDILEYTLITTNSQNFDRLGVTVSDFIGDILDYADLDTDFLAEQGAEFQKDSNKIIWNDVKIPANSSINHVFRVKIKDPIPATNSPSNLSTNFDCKITNQYGNEISMDINCPLVKGVEDLPNTGPGTNIAISVGMTTVIGYFFFRSRLLAKEIDIIRKDYVATGGM